MILGINVSETLKQTLLSSLPQTVSALTGGGIGLVAAWATNHSAVRRMQLQLAEERARTGSERTRVHADDLYMMFSAWSKTLVGHHMLALPAWTATVEYNSLLDFQRTAMDKAADKYTFERIEMLIGAFFPHLSPAFSEVLLIRDVLARHETTLRASYRTTHRESLSPDPILGELEKFVQASQAFKENIIAEIVRLNK